MLKFERNEESLQKKDKIGVSLRWARNAYKPLQLWLQLKQFKIKENRRLNFRVIFDIITESDLYCSRRDGRISIVTESYSMETSQPDNLIDSSLIQVIAFRVALSNIKGVSIWSYRPPEDRPEIIWKPRFKNGYFIYEWLKINWKFKIN